MQSATVAPEQADPTSRATPRRWRRTATSLTVVSWLYAVALVSLWLLLRFGADRWWFATVAMFSPRWLASLPLIVLVPPALLLRRRAVLLPLSVAAVLAFGPVMRLCVPWRRALPGPAATPRSLRVATFNADQEDLDPAALRQWLEAARPDVIALQAFTSRQQRKVFGNDGGLSGWHVRKHGELLLASRHPITADRPYDDPYFFSAGDGGTLAAYQLQTPAGPLHVFNVHLATPRYGLLAVAQDGRAGAPQLRSNIERRRQQSQLARRWIDASTRPGDRVLVMGDLNMPPDSAVYREFFSDLTNAYSFAGFGFGNTHFTRHTAVRIDHVLAGPSLRVRRSWVGPYLASAHRPVVADVEIIAEKGKG